MGTFIIAPSINYVESSDLWHQRLGHLNFGTLENMINLELIPNYVIENKSKCQVFVTTKQTRNPFHNVARDLKVLDLVHMDICE